jgi:hypothetical protein
VTYNAQAAKLWSAKDFGNFVDLIAAAPSPLAAPKEKLLLCSKIEKPRYLLPNGINLHYCFVCDKVAHPTLRCSVLKALQPSAYVHGAGLVETYFTALPDSVVNEDLAPPQTHVAIVVVLGMWCLMMWLLSRYQAILK